jgi:hypothetical protein
LRGAADGSTAWLISTLTGSPRVPHFTFEALISSFRAMSSQA